VTTQLPIPPEHLEGFSILQDMEASNGESRDLTSQQIPALKAMFEDESGMGLWLFAYFICGCRDITLKLHLEECWFLSKWGYIELKDGSKRRLMLCVPRDTFKTTIGTRATSLWAASKDPEITVGIFNEAESNVKSWLGSIRNVIECSKLYQDLWKELLPTGIHYEDTRSKPRSLKWGQCE
jgi:hypothetical protein